MSDEIKIAVSMFERVAGAAGAIAKGSPLVYDSSIGKYVLSTAANRAAANARTQAFSLDANGANVIDGTVAYVQAGMLPATLANIGTGAGGQLVRVTDAGGLARISSYTVGDDVIGYSEADGRVHLHIGLPWEMIASLAGGITGRKVVYGNGVLAGADNVRISADGDLTFGDDPASQGRERFSNGDAVFVKSGGDTPDDICVWQHQNVAWRGSDAMDTMFIGALNVIGIPVYGFQAIRIRGNILEFRTDGSDGADNGSVSAYFGAWSQGVFTGNPTSHGFYCGPNFYFRVGGASDFEDENDPFFGARGVMRIDKRVTDPSETPVGCVLISGNPTTGSPEALLPGDDPSTGWRDLLSSSETTVNVTSNTPGDIAITSATRVVNCESPGEMNLVGFTAPTAPAAGVVTVTNNSDTAIKVTPSSGVIAANGIAAAVSGGTTLSIPTFAALTFAYDHNLHRWVAQYGVTANVP